MSDISRSHQSQRHQSPQKLARAHRAGLLWRSLLVALALMGVLMTAGIPSLDSDTLVQAPVKSGQQLSVKVVDVLSQRPIAGAFVSIPGVPRLVLTDAQGRASLAVPAGVKLFSLKISHPDYMGTTQTRIASGTKALSVGIPHLKRLKEADAMIRDPQTLDPHRQQQFVAAPTPPQVVPSPNQRKLPINTPIAVTYPMPSHIIVKKTDGSTIRLPLEEYLKGVLPREIGTSFPMEAKKAQAVAARTYTVQYTQGGKKEICTTTTCQVWGTTQYASTSAAVDATKGQVVVHNGTLAGGYFAASCGGRTINSEDKWNYRAFLRAVPCIENKKGACSQTCQLSTCGGGKCANSHATCWGVFGHRIGLCQRGAEAMGKCGKTYVDIVKHYYTGVEVANLVTQPNPVDNAKLVRETVPSGTKMLPGQAVTKEWRMENTGNTTWTAGDKYSLVRNDGTSFGAGASIALPASAKIAPTQAHSFSIKITAPTKDGSYVAKWQMAKNGKKFGQVVSISLIVQAPPPACKDNDKDGFSAPGTGCPTPHDCDDNNKDINPGAREVCGNGKDDDCKDGDAKCSDTCKDDDKDGYYAAGPTCPEPHDCDDNDKNVNPGAREACGNGKDDDCSNGDLTCPSNCEDKDSDGYGSGSGCPEPKDCDDNNKDIYPGAPEICGNGKDEDCREGDRKCGTTDPPPTKKPMGAEGCTRHSDCETNVCVENGGKAMCTKKCTATTDCPTGYECLQGQACWPKAGTKPPTTPPSTECRQANDCPVDHTCLVGRCTPAKKGCGCHTGNTPGQGPTWLLWIGLVFLGLVRMRR